MGTRSIISFTPSKDMKVTFDPFKLPDGNPFAPFEDEVGSKKATLITSIVIGMATQKVLVLRLSKTSRTRTQLPI